MITLFSWILILSANLFDRSPQSFILNNADIASGILFLCMEVMIFFDLPGSKILKNSLQFSLKNSVLLKTFSENENKIKKIRLAVFIPTLVLALVISGIFRRSQMFWYYFCFWFCINSDIAFILASPEERKLYWKKFGIVIAI